MFSFGHNSRNNLQGVHPDLIKVAEKALSYGVMDFAVVQGCRTEAEQARLYAQGRATPGPVVTWTMKSKHIIQTSGYGHAIDIAPIISGKISWDEKHFDLLAALMFRAAMELGKQIKWGGFFPPDKDGNPRTDKPHFEMP